MKYGIVFGITAIIFNTAVHGTYFVITRHAPTMFESILIGIVLAAPISLVAKALTK